MTREFEFKGGDLIIETVDGAIERAEAYVPALECFIDVTEKIVCSVYWQNEVEVEIASRAIDASMDRVDLIEER